LSLDEVIALVDGAPTTIKENASALEAGAIKARLEAMGATVELR
jgi:ribosomal protein L7/L12